MHALRDTAFLARLVLAWFALFLGVAMAAPVIHPHVTEVVCSAGGAVKMLLKGDPAHTAGAHAMDCPLCAPSGAPLAASAGWTPALAPRPAVPSVFAARVGARTHPIAPARGPPVQRAS